MEKIRIKVIFNNIPVRSSVMFATIVKKKKNENVSFEILMNFMQKCHCYM